MPLDPRTFPRPPLLEKITKHLLVKWPGTNGGIIAETKSAYWVLETYHPPTYYLPQSSIQAALAQTRRSTFCEWKGAATYYSIKNPQTGENVENRAWSYESPSERFKDLKGFVSFYEGPWECYVDGERVEAQPGSFYGGWMTSDILRESVKGRKGTEGW